jgi:antitoxin FitA
MASLLIRNLDDRTKSRLRKRAAERGHSMEEEARAILRGELSRPAAPKSLTALAREIFGDKGVDLEIPPRVPIRSPPDFNG